jgi:hypothetical protein
MNDGDSSFIGRCLSGTQAFEVLRSLGMAAAPVPEAELPKQLMDSLRQYRLSFQTSAGVSSASFPPRLKAGAPKLAR